MDNKFSNPTTNPTGDVHFEIGSIEGMTLMGTGQPLRIRASLLRWLPWTWSKLIPNFLVSRREEGLCRNRIPLRRKGYFMPSTEFSPPRP